MNDYRYILDPSPRKFACPACGKKRFVRYVDSQTGEYLPEEFGRCDREDSCRYHYNPYEEHYGRDSLSTVDSLTPDSFRKSAPALKHTTFIPFDIFSKSRTAYERNNFVSWLSSHFDSDTVARLIARYHIGTSKKWEGATIFYQIDEQARIRRGKIMLYDPQTGRRVKEPYPHISSVHSALNRKDEKPDPCLYGLHLLNESDNPIAIVESEKTAIIGSVYLSQFIWMATGSKGNLKPELLAPLKGRSIVLFPDVGAWQDWKDKSKGTPGVSVSGLLEERAGMQEQGYDLADYLIQFSPKKKPVEPVPIRKQSAIGRIKQSDPAIQTIIDTFDCEITNKSEFETEQSYGLTADGNINLNAEAPF